MIKRTAISIFLLISLGWIAACSSGTPSGAAKESTAPVQSQPNANKGASAATHEVLISGFKFQPADLTVNVGDTVEWKNMDAMPHNAVAKDKTFDSGKLSTGMTGKYVAQAKDKGTHEYTCTFHPNMKGKLIVQ
jgi:plastocyanin